MRRRRAILIAEDPDKTEKHRESRIALPIRRKKICDEPQAQNKMCRGAEKHDKKMQRM